MVEAVYGEICAGPWCGPTSEQLQKELTPPLKTRGIDCILVARCHGHCQEGTTNYFVKQGFGILETMKRAAVKTENGIITRTDELVERTLELANEPPPTPPSWGQ